MENYHHSPLTNSSSSFHMTNPPQENRRGGSKRPAGVKLSTDPQSIAARQRRHRISDRFRTLKGLVPGGSKMDTVSMLEEAINYVKFLKTQIWLHQAAAVMAPPPPPPQLDHHDYDQLQQIPPFIPSHDQQMLSCYSSTPTPPPSLPPFPYSSFQGEDEMLPRVTFQDY